MDIGIEDNVVWIKSLVWNSTWRCLEDTMIEMFCL